MSTELDYCCKFEKNIITPDEKDFFTQCCFDHSDKFVPYISNVAPDKFGGNLFFNYINFPEYIKHRVDQIRARFRVTTHPKLALQKPGTLGIRHYDDRQAAIIIPLYPDSSFPYNPTLFWKSFEDSSPVFSLSYQDHIPGLINTRQIHSVDNDTSMPRYALQFGFQDIEFSKIRELLINDQLVDYPS